MSYIKHWAKEPRHNFEFYLSRGSGEMVWVLYDPETEYYMRRTLKMAAIKHKELDNHISKIIPDDLDEKYRSTFSKAVKDNWFGLFKLHQSGPHDYAMQIPGLYAVVKHPVAGREGTIHDIIIELNDTLGWTRERIADWLETLDENPIIEPPKEDD